MLIFADDGALVALCLISLCEDVPALLQGLSIKDGVVRAFFEHHDDLEEGLLVLVKPCPVVGWAEDRAWRWFGAAHNVP